MKKNDSLPLDRNFISSNELEDQQVSSKDSIPVFLLPYGYHSLSLFQIAQFYDGTAANFYKNIIFARNFNEKSKTQPDSFSKHNVFDYSHCFHQIISNFQIPKSIQSSQYIKLSDRFFDMDFFLTLPPLGDLSFVSYHIPKGKEDGIVYILSQTREFTRSHLFSLMSAPFSSLSAKVTITAGQPFLLNKILSKTYTNVDSIYSRKESLTNDINNLKQNSFQIDWAIASINGFSTLILVRPPQYLRISDRHLELFDGIEKAFENSNVYLVCYRHSQFINNTNFEKSIESSEVDKPIKSDTFFCSLLKDEMKKNFLEKNSMDFLSYLVYSLRFPSFFLMNCGFEKEIAMAASVFVDDPKGRSASLFIPILSKKMSNKSEVDDQKVQKKSDLEPIGNAPAPASTVFESDTESKSIEKNSSNEEEKEIKTSIEKVEKSDSKENDFTLSEKPEKETNENDDNDDDESNSAAVFVSPFQDQDEVESKLFSTQSMQVKIAVQEYFKFCFWLRSFITVIKCICRRDIMGIADNSLSCFRSLPLRNRRVVVSTILILTESLRKFRKQRSPSDEFYQKVLRIFKSLFGEEFDQILGLHKWEVPREMRSQVVCVDNCVKMFYVRTFKNEKISINNVIYRLTKYMEPVMKEFSFDQEVPNFKFCQSYIDFLKLQKFEKIIEI